MYNYVAHPRILKAQFAVISTVEKLRVHIRVLFAMLAGRSAIIYPTTCTLVTIHYTHSIHISILIFTFS